jgi:hypothetical protein
MAICIECDKHYSDARYLLGRLTCLNCGQISALQKKHTIVPTHKQGNSVYTGSDAREVVQQLNPKSFMGLSAGGRT